MLRLHIHPVYSEENRDLNYQIGSIRLLKHQVATYEQGVTLFGLLFAQEECNE